MDAGVLTVTGASEAATKEMAKSLLEQERPTTMIDALGNVSRPACFAARPSAHTTAHMGPPIWHEQLVSKGLPWLLSIDCTACPCVLLCQVCSCSVLTGAC